MRFSALVVPLLAVVAVAIVLLAGMRLLVRDTPKAAIVATVVCAMFFSYGHIMGAAMPSPGQESFNWSFNEAKVLIWLGMIVVVAMLLIWRAPRSCVKLTKFANIILICVTAVPVAHILPYQVKRVVRNARRQAPKEVISLNVDASQPKPNIIYMVIDAYARGDILKDLYGYDNGEFLGFLSSKGFYVADNARSNYAQTVLSQSSTLNMTYLDKQIEAAGPDSKHSKQIVEMIKSSKICNALSAIGYEIINFSSGFSGTMDIGQTQKKQAFRDLEFEGAFISQTLWGAVTTRFWPQYFNEGAAVREHRRRITDALDNLPALCESTKPFFAYAHIICPHPPFVFQADGSHFTPPYKYTTNVGNRLMNKWWRITQDEYRQYYLRQLKFMNSRLKKTISEIQERSSRPTIILLQSDHGPASMLSYESVEESNPRERMSIISAYYFPDGDYSGLYEGITPVNSFRVLFNKYFGQKLDMLSDESYFSVYEQPFRMHRVTDQLTLSETGSAVADLQPEPASPSQLPSEGESN